METQTVDVLRSITPFSTLSDEVLAEVAAQVHFQDFAPGAYVFRQGTPSLNTLFLVVKGLGEVRVMNERGKETVVGYRHVHDFFGETVVLTDEDYPGSVLAKEAMTCLVIPREVFERLMYNHPEVAGFFSRALLSRMRRLYQEIVAEQAPSVYVHGESSLFRRWVAEIMSSPVITCRANDRLRNVAELMVYRNISAVVVIDDTGYPVGLVTERELVIQLAEPAPGGPADLAAETVMQRKLVEVPTAAFLCEALVQMIKHGVKHLVAMESGLPAGIVSVTDLPRARSAGTLWLAHRIETAQTLTGLCDTGQEVENFLSALVAGKTAVPDLLNIMAELHDALTRCVIRLCKEEIEAEHGPRPADYCWIAMGSAGRKEQTIRTDQDNALIYADPEPGAAAETVAYFNRLGTNIIKALERCGFQECRGGVMPSNPEWCRPLGEWREHVLRMITRAGPQDVRTLTILLDFRPVYGNFKLAQDLWDAVFQALQQVSGGSPHILADVDLRMRAPLTLFGDFVTEKSGPHKNELNLKIVACVHIVNCVRLFALKHRITETPTLERLRLLVEADAIPREETEFIEAAYETLLMFRIRENLKKMSRGAEPDNYVNPQALSKREQEILKDSLSVIPRLQKLTSS